MNNVYTVVPGSSAIQWCVTSKKMALRKEFVLLQPNKCDGLQPRQNRGLKCKMCRVYINIYAQGWAAKHYQCWLDESWFCNTKRNQWVASKASRHAFMAIGDQLCSNLTPVWHYFSLKAFADAFYCLRAYPLYSKSDFNDYEGAWFTATVMHCHEQLCISSLYFHSGGR